MSATAPPGLWSMPTRQWKGWVLAASGAAAVLALAGCGASQPQTRPAVLEVTGIGNVAFGRPSRRVVQRLDRMLGRRGSASAVFRGRGPRACGFDHEIVWSSLATTVAIGPTVGLTVYLKRGRFVGYAYGPPYGGRGVEPVRDGPILATAAGLGLGDALRRGHQL